MSQDETEGPPPEPTEARPSYERETYWRRYQPYFPPELRVEAATAPRETWWRWKEADVHLDRYEVPSPDALLVVLHGAGGYGRMMGQVGVAARRRGYAAVAPDLPGYGLTRAPDGLVDYGCWIDLVTDLVASERARTSAPLVLVGASLGGPLAYQVASRTDVAGLAATMLLDPEDPEAREAMARFSRLTGPLIKTMDALSGVTDPVPVPVGFVAPLEKIANDPEVAELVKDDPQGGGRAVAARLMRTLMTTPVPPPEDFDACPVLLAHPAADRWTPPELSRRFFERLRVPKKLVLLEKAGHWPVEEAALAQFQEALGSFVDEVVGG